jgi:hypothetical protein
VVGVGAVVLVGAPFLWLGMVLAISGLEAPLKFRAPGITVALGLGIGRLVFRALNASEVVLALLLVSASATTGMSTAGWSLLAGLIALLAVQVLLLRPGLDRRARAILAGHSPPPSHRHQVYIVMEGVKVLGLAALGTVLALSGLS